VSPPPDFVIECQEPMPPLRTHRASLLVVLQNLIATRSTSDRPDGHVNDRHAQTERHGRFRVGDDGPGIAPRFHERIFVIFQTLASRDEVESSGIGLAIVKKRIEGHGGASAWKASRPLAVPPSSSPEGSNVMKDTTVTVLLVDDDKVDTMAVSVRSRP